MYVTAPMMFVAAGAALSAILATPSLETVLQIKVVAEMALALILFHDAAQLRPRQIGRDAGLAVRLLLIALPVNVAFGYFGGLLLLPEVPLWTLLLLAAALAPTDSGLGAATVLNPVVPVRVRRLLNLEGGLNDGLVTPVVLFAIAGAGGQVHASAVSAVLGPLGGVVVGVVVGAASGLLLGWSARHDFSSAHTRSLGVLGIPILAFWVSEAMEANPYIAAFVAGTAFAASSAWADREHSALGLTEALSEPLSFGVWLVFGLAATPVIVSSAGVAELVYAVLSLTLFRMLGVMLSLVGTGFRWQTFLFVGWFGPRGLVTVIFMLIALEHLELTDTGRSVLATASLTVVLSVLAHGLTADPLANRYGQWVSRVRPHVELESAAEPRARTSYLGRRHQHDSHDSRRDDREVDIDGREQ